jgi:hypothetical protein
LPAVLRRFKDEPTAKKGFAMLRKLVFALGLALAGAGVLVPLAASAQWYPAPPPPPPPPRFYQNYDLRGFIAYSRPYYLTLDNNGRQVPVYLHNGTVILPTGLTLQRGMSVGIMGRWSGSNFVADRIILLR